MSWFNGERNPELLREKAEKLRQARNDLRGVGWTMLATQLIHSWVAMALVSILAGWRLAPQIRAMAGDAALAVEDLFQRVAPLMAELMKTDWYANVIAVLTVAVALLGVIPALVYARRRSMTLRPMMGLKGLKAGQIAALYLAMMGINALGALGAMATEALFNRAGYSIYIDILTDDTAFSFWTTGLYAVLLAPLIEEYVYRGVLLEGLRRYGERFAVMVAAVIFGLAHGNLMQFLPAALIGWFFGYVRVKSGSWSVCVLLHALNNLTSLLLEGLLDRVTSEALYNAVNTAYMAVTVIAFFVIWRGVKARCGDLAEAEEPVGYGALISAPALIYLYMVFQMLVTSVSKLA